jgi:6-phosphogluconate dehydrogenase
MKLGLVGQGKMGAGIARRLAASGHDVVAFDSSTGARAAIESPRIGTRSDLALLCGELPPPRVIWLMVPAGSAVEDTIARLSPTLVPGDILIDGGNSNYRDTRRRGESLRNEGIHFVDVGTSGGVHGEADGYCLMIGGDRRIVESLEWLWTAMAPAPDRGWGRTGPSGAGHYAKMVHNGIEYGMMQALAEGLALLERHPDFEFDLARMTRIWNEGSVIRSWLVELAGDALDRNPDLDGIAAEVADSGEGRWAVAEAIDLDVAAPVLTDALLTRIGSRETNAFSNRVLSALRREFGGHAAGGGK